MLTFGNAKRALPEQKMLYLRGVILRTPIWQVAPFNYNRESGSIFAHINEDQILYQSGMVLVTY